MKKDFDRKQGIGGSDATRIYQGNWYDLYLEKIGEKEARGSLQSFTSTNGSTYRRL